MKESLVSRMKKGEFIVSIQLDPPKAEHFEELLTAVSKLKTNGVTVFDINSSRRDCMDAFDVAARISRDKNIEIVPHITARDAGLTPILQQIKDEYTEHNIKNVLVVTGDRYKPLEDGTADPRNIFQTKSVGIISSINKYLNPVEKNITIAAAVNHNEKNVKKEVNRLRAKDRQGADFFMSQTVFDIDQAQNAHNFYAENSDKPLLIGIWPITKITTMDNIRNGNIKGVELSDETYREAETLRDNPKALHNWGIDKAVQTAKYIKENALAQGVYVVAPLRQPAELVDFVKTFNQ
jgi:methionine synthase / methylenetetrahydrofolate reductase(NADPH)